MNLCARPPRFRNLFIILHLFTVLLFLSAPAFAADKRDILWEIVSTCMDCGVKDYCSTCVAPRVEADCKHSCKETSEVWSESTQFVVIRDRKMCDCPEGFVHGLAIPRTRVTGVEDPARPDGIWSYAWSTAARRIPENEIALAVNPRGNRSQDQLHVHLVRVIREKLPADPRRIVQVDNLASVWKVAAGKAAELAWQDYGVLVVKGAENGYLVVIDEGSTEHKFTRARCQ
jgi:CDP-diacylglycerol pyrophosphatase